MNKPAPQEPSMDEILSSIRQIIADDDAGSRRAAPATPASAPPASPMALRPQVAMPVETTPEPLPLSTSQIVADEPAEDEAEGDPAPEPLSYQSILSKEPEETGTLADAQLVDPEDVAFEPDPEPAPPPPAFAPRPSPRPSASVARVAPMPDPRLSADLAERLIEPATRAAVQQNFARLNSQSQVPAGQTIDGMMRDMLRPMLKAWLDEHLPSVVERMVEKENARISRGVE
jgi:cell pole-organizing protein PopZ